MYIESLLFSHGRAQYLKSLYRDFTHERENLKSKVKEDGHRRLERAAPVSLFRKPARDSVVLRQQQSPATCTTDDTSILYVLPHPTLIGTSVLCMSPSVLPERKNRKKIKEKECTCP